MKSKVKLPKALPEDKRKVLFFKAVELNVPTLVFAPPAMAEGHDKVMKALLGSKTWREFRASIPASEFKQIKQLLRERGGYSAAELREIVADDNQFNASVVPGVEDAEYPSMIAGIQRSILPKSIAEKYGKNWGALNCSDILQLDIGDREAIVADLQGMGYEVIERDDLNFF